VTPTECWLKGGVNPRTQLERKFSRWSLYSRIERTRELEAHIADVFEPLTMNKRQFIELPSKHSEGDATSSVLQDRLSGLRKVLT
jgi:uncharacterized protein DUF4279